MSDVINEKYQEHFDEIKGALDKVSTSDKKKVEQLYGTLKSKLKKSTLISFLSNPRKIYDYIDDIFKDYTIKDMLRLIGPILIALSTLRLYRHVMKIINNPNSYNGDWKIFYTCLTALLIVIIFLTIMENVYIRKHINDNKDTIYKLAKEWAINYKRYWLELKKGEYAKLIVDVIKSSLISGYHIALWQFELAQKDTGYAILLFLQWILAVGVFVSGSKLFLDEIIEALN